MTAARKHRAGRVRPAIDLWAERALLSVILLTLWGGPVAWGGRIPEAATALQALAALALLLWAVRLWAQPGFRLFWPPVCWAVAVFLLYAVPRCHFVPVELAGRRELCNVLAYAAVFLCLLNNFHRRDAATALAVGLMALGTVESLLAVHQVLAKSTAIFGVAFKSQFVGRGCGTYLNPNHLACFLGMTLPLAISYTFYSRFTAAMKVLTVSAALVMLAGIGVTLSRGGIVSAGVMLLVFCAVVLRQKGGWLPAFIALAAVAAVGFAVVTMSDSVQQRFEGTMHDNQFSDLRRQYWYAAVHVFEDDPLWGAGPGQFDYTFARYRHRYVQVRPEFAHNDYLNTLADWGAVGLVVVLAAVGLVFAGAWKTLPAVTPPEVGFDAVPRSNKVAFIIGAGMGLVYLLVHSLVDFDMHLPANALLAVAFMALITSLWRFASDRYWVDPHRAGKLALTVLLLAGAGWLANQDWRAGRECYWLAKMADESAPVPRRLAAFHQAWEAEPSDYVTAYNLGEYYRWNSSQANPGWEKDARTAMEWYDRSMKLNALDAYVPMRYGMCLDWLGQTNEATAWFDRAVKLDPNNQQITYYMGRHQVELNDLAGADRWFRRSMEIHWTEETQTALNGVKERMESPLYK